MNFILAERIYHAGVGISTVSGAIYNSYKRDQKVGCILSGAIIGFAFGLTWPLSVPALLYYANHDN